MWWCMLGEARTTRDRCHTRAHMGRRAGKVGTIGSRTWMVLIISWDRDDVRRARGERRCYGHARPQWQRRMRPGGPSLLVTGAMAAADWLRRDMLNRMQIGCRVIGQDFVVFTFERPQRRGPIDMTSACMMWMMDDRTPRSFLPSRERPHAPQTKDRPTPAKKHVYFRMARW